MWAHTTRSGCISCEAPETERIVQHREILSFSSAKHENVLSKDRDCTVFEREGRRDKESTNILGTPRSNTQEKKR